MSANNSWGFVTLLRRFEGAAKVAIVGIAIVWVIAFFHKTAVDHAIANVTRPGVTLKSNRNFPVWIQWLPDSVKNLLIKEKYTLKIAGTRIDDNELYEVADLAGALRGLRRVELNGTRLQSLSFLQHLPEVLSLSVVDTPLDDFSGLQHPTKLQSLVLCDTDHRREDLKHLQALTSLQYLDLSSSIDASMPFSQATADSRKRAAESTDKVLADIAALSKLEVLDISNRTFTGEGASQIAKLASLHGLVIYGHVLDDAIIDTLAGCTGLTDLCISTGQFSDTAIEKFRLACPNCKIHSGPTAMAFGYSLRPSEE